MVIWWDSMKQDHQSFSLIWIVLKDILELVCRWFGKKALSSFLDGLINNLFLWALVFLGLPILSLSFISPVVRVCAFFIPDDWLTVWLMLSSFPIYLQNNSLLCIPIIYQCWWLSLILHFNITLFEFRFQKAVLCKGRIVLWNALRTTELNRKFTMHGYIVN